MYLCDIHTHSLISPDSEAPLTAMAEAAASAGLRELCVTDHCDLLHWEGRPGGAFDWAAAKEQYRAAKAAFGGRLTLRLGLELGSAPFDPDKARAVIAGGGEELDFVLGSLHNWIGDEGNIDFYFSGFAGDAALCRGAMDNALSHTWALAAKYPDCYDSLAHVLYPLRYIRRDGMDLPLADYEAALRAIFTEVARTGHAPEVNTHHGQDMDDWPLLLRWFKECGGELVTVGSDAHRPGDVAGGVPQALELIKAAGFERVAAFEKRRPVTHPL